VELADYLRPVRDRRLWAWIRVRHFVDTLIQMCVELFIATVGVLVVGHRSLDRA
jgi:hypothetical protein